MPNQCPSPPRTSARAVAGFGLVSSAGLQESSLRMGRKELLQRRCLTRLLRPQKSLEALSAWTGVLARRLRSKTTVVSDGWKSTAAAARNLGLKIKECQHSQNFRNKNTGFHSNVAGSEFARFKLWSRQKWARMRTVNSRDQSAQKAHMEGHVAKYILQTNCGNNMRLPLRTVLNAFGCVAGCPMYKSVSLQG